MPPGWNFCYHGHELDPVRRRSFIKAVFGAIAGTLLWPVRKIHAWRARILVNGRPLPNGSMVEVSENHWHGKIDGSRLRPGDDLAVQFQRVSVEGAPAAPKFGISLES